MRRFFCFLAAVLVLCMTVFSVSAAVSISSSDISVSVNKNSSCQVFTKVTLHIDKATPLNYPIPKDARHVKANGGSVRTTESGDVRFIDLSQVLGKATGDFVVTIQYELPDVVYSAGKNMLELRIPLASGFSHPIESMSFTVTLPGEAENLPTFESGYHQANIERDITYTREGPMISGSFTAALKDHETVTMKLRVSEKMFPQNAKAAQDYTFALRGMAVCGVLALLYWLIFLRSWPFHWKRTTEPQQGITAGEVASALCLQGANLHLTVLSWANLGYIMLYVEKGDKILLRKRMDMGNERKEEEQKLFSKLFSKGDIVDTRSLHYASLALAANQKPMGMRERVHRRSGNTKVFRFLGAGIGLFGGICVAVAMTGGAILQGLLILLLGALGGLSGWYLQKWAYGIVPCDRHRLTNSLLLCGAWLVLGWIAGAFQAAMYMVLGLLATGFMLAMGGRRTDFGKEAMAQMMGLRNYLRFADKILLQRLCGNDPDYFFEMAPYAIALGVGTSFAKRFGGVRLGACPYLATAKEENLNALDWTKRLQFVLDCMDQRARTLPRERTARLMRNMTKR